MGSSGSGRTVSQAWREGNRGRASLTDEHRCVAEAGRWAGGRAGCILLFCPLPPAGASLWLNVAMNP